MGSLFGKTPKPQEIQPPPPPMIQAPSVSYDPTKQKRAAANYGGTLLTAGALAAGSGVGGTRGSGGNTLLGQ